MTNTHTSAQPRTLRIAICGAGVGGLTLAAVLAHHTHTHQQSQDHTNTPNAHTPPRFEIDIFESSPALREVGAGIGMWPRTWGIMRHLGLDKGLARVAIVPAEGIPKVAFHFRKGDQPEGFTFDTLVTPGGLISIHRPDFQAVLLEYIHRLCPSSPSSSSSASSSSSSSSSSASCTAHPTSGCTLRTHTSKRLQTYITNTDGSVEVRFADGTSAGPFDVLVGADGVHSRVRATLMSHLAYSTSSSSSASSSTSSSSPTSTHANGNSNGNSNGSGKTGKTGNSRGKKRDPTNGLSASELLARAEARWSGTYVYRAVLPVERYLGKNSQMTIYPMSHGTLINFAAFRADYALEHTLLPHGTVPVQNVSARELEEAFGGWEGELCELVDCIQTASRWAVQTVLPLPTFVSEHGSVVLLGDAAHAMMPYQGSGAGQAIEDAYLLGTLLAHTPHNTPIARVAEVYDAVRRPAAQRVASVSRDAGLLYTFNYPGLEVRGDVGGHGASCAPEERAMGGQNGEDGRETEAEKENQRKLHEVYRRVRENWVWAWDTSVDGDVERAVRMLSSES
ncbi:FAD/NAD(P)-binding domain-containing protein [Trametopsis cervina]|nr:FAD/NAD(P)-binding domain-containing protein [Trametopsis cervina]